MCWLFTVPTAAESRFLILGLMWCPEFRPADAARFPGEFERPGPRLGPDEYQIASYLDSYRYSGCVYVPCWLAGITTRTPLAAALTDRFPESAGGTAALILFLLSLRRRAGFVSFCARRRARLGADFSSPTCQDHFLSAGRDDQWRHLGALALPQSYCLRTIAAAPVVVSSPWASR